MIKKIIFLPLILLFTSSCQMNMSQKQILTPLEIQSLQSREYEEDMKIVFSSVVSVFQDIGYTISSADSLSGLIVAESTADSDFASKFWLGITNVSQTKANAFVETIGSMTKVRINFVTSNEQSFGYGQTDRKDVQILDAEPYRLAFEKIENAIFVRSSAN